MTVYIRCYTAQGLEICTAKSESSFGPQTLPWVEHSTADDSWFTGADVPSALAEYKWNSGSGAPVAIVRPADQDARDAALRAVDLDTTSVVALYDFVPVHTPILDKLSPPCDLDFDRSLDSGLLKELAVVQEGEVRQVKRWRSSTGSALSGDLAYSGLIVQEDLAYVRDSGGYAKSRTRTLTWLLKDETPHASTKVKPKVYDAIASRNEGIRRREYHVANVEMSIIGLMRLTAANDAGSSLYGDSNTEITRKGGLLLSAMGDTIPNFIRYDDEAPMMGRLSDPLDPDYVQATGDLTWLDEAAWGQSGATFRQIATSLLQPSYNALTDMETRFGEAGGTDAERDTRLAAIRATDPALVSDAATWRAIYAWAQQTQDMLDAISDPPAGDEQEWLSIRDSRAAWAVLAANPPTDEAAKTATRDELTAWYATGSGAETDRRATRWASIALELEAAP